MAANHFPLYFWTIVFSACEIQWATIVALTLITAMPPISYLAEYFSRLYTLAHLAEQDFPVCRRAISMQFTRKSPHNIDGKDRFSATTTHQLILPCRLLRCNGCRLFACGKLVSCRRPFVMLLKGFDIYTTKMSTMSTMKLSTKLFEMVEPQRDQ